jgi:hypothetical protein
MNLSELQETTSARIGELRSQRALLSLDVLAGEDEAQRKLDEIEHELREQQTRAELAELAVAERARRDQEAAARQEQERRDKALAEVERLAQKRHGEMQALAGSLAGVRGRVAQILAIEAQLQNASVNAGVHAVLLKGQIQEMAIVSLQDAGLVGDCPPYVRAAIRNRLVETYPALNGLKKPKTVAHPRCSICTNPQRLTIEDLIEGGESHRAIEAQFSVSKSAVSRHVQHSEGEEVDFNLSLADLPEGDDDE